MMVSGLVRSRLKSIASVIDFKLLSSSRFLFRTKVKKETVSD